MPAARCASLLTQLPGAVPSDSGTRTTFPPGHAHSLSARATDRAAVQTRGSAYITGVCVPFQHGCDFCGLRCGCCGACVAAPVYSSIPPLNFRRTQSEPRTMHHGLDAWYSAPAPAPAGAARGMVHGMDIWGRNPANEDTMPVFEAHEAERAERIARKEVSRCRLMKSRQDACPLKWWRDKGSQARAGDWIWGRWSCAQCFRGNLTHTHVTTQVWVTKVHHGSVVESPAAEQH